MASGPRYYVIPIIDVRDCVNDVEKKFWEWQGNETRGIFIDSNGPSGNRCIGAPWYKAQQGLRQ